MNSIKDNVYYVGVKDSNLKKFDVSLSLENGTTYNAYLIKDIKNVLIDTVKEEFFHEFMLNINSVMPVEKIDYLVLNHTEPDHAGSVKKLLEKNPNIKIITTTAGANNLKEIMNRDASIRVIKEMTELKIGAETLTFIPAPCLHWPDTMFTKLENSSILFTGDFLGAHYTEEGMLLDADIKNVDKYIENVNIYYSAIMAPFANFVQKGLDIVKENYPEYICPSHGPVLKDKKQDVITKYVINSAKKEYVNVPVVYVSAYGYTKALAEEIENYVNKNSSLHAKLYNLEEIENLEEVANEIIKSRMLFIGTPTINKDSPVEVKKLIALLDRTHVEKKEAYVFGSYGWSGEAIKNTITRLEMLGVKAEELVKVKFCPSEEDLENVRKSLDEIIKK